MRKISYILPLAVVGLLVIWVVGERVARGQATVTGAAEIRSFGFVNVNCEDPVCLQGPGSSFVDIPGAAVTFTLPGGPGRRVLVHFQARWGGGLPTASGARALVRLAVDGVVQEPFDMWVFTTRPDGGNGTHGWQWTTSPLSAGSHTAQLRFSNLGPPGTGTIHLFDVAMAVFHR